MELRLEFKNEISSTSHYRMASKNSIHSAGDCSDSWHWTVHPRFANYLRGITSHNNTKTGVIPPQRYCYIHYSESRDLGRTSMNELIGIISREMQNTRFGTIQLALTMHDGQIRCVNVTTTTRHTITPTQAREQKNDKKTC